MADIERKPLPFDDPRIKAVATLWSGGRIVHHAAVLAPDIALTVLPSTGYDAIKVGNGTPQKVAVIARSDTALGVAVLNLAGPGANSQLPRLGGRWAAGQQLSFVEYDDKANTYYERVGHVPNPSISGAILGQGSGIVPPSFYGAPVFSSDGLLVGIARSGSGSPLLIEIIFLDAMLFRPGNSLGAVLSPKRQAEIRVKDGAADVLPTIAELEGVAGQASHLQEGGGAPEPRFSKTEFFARLSPSARRAMERAAAMRRDRKAKIHMEDLLSGLYQDLDSFFARSGVSEDQLRKIIRETVSREMVRQYRTVELTGLPPLSGHVTEALLQAARDADERGAKQIWSRHLLYGALSVNECRVVQALNAAGVRREGIGPTEGVDLEREQEAAPPPPPPARAAPSDQELFARLTNLSRKALARAEGIRLALGKTQVNTEYLIAGLLPSWKNFFDTAKVGPEDLREVVRHEFGVELPSEYSIPQLNALPPLSNNSREALSEALKYAESRGAERIWSKDFLYGALSVTRSKTVRALNRLGMRREAIASRNETSITQEELGQETPIRREDIASRNETLLTQDSPTGAGAAPAPKVDSDKWCEKDRLGYEAYAVTIARLITHAETAPPLTIGIKAPWGAGKTSLMKSVQRLLDGKAHVSEENRAAWRQQWQVPQVTLREMLRELRQSVESGLAPETGPSGKPCSLPAVESKEGREHGVKPRITVWFNAWKYRTSEQIWAGMAHCIISQVTARMTARNRELFWLRLNARRVKVDEVRWRILESVFRYLLPVVLLVAAVCVCLFGALLISPVLMPPLAAYASIHPRVFVALKTAIPAGGILTVAWKAFGKLGDKAAGTVRELVREPGYEGKMGYLHLVESDIDAVLDLASVSKEQPLVIFVDDLDRCSPNKVAEVVEAINLFLCGDYPNCIFVLGMEPGMVAAALEVANKDVIEKAQAKGLVSRHSQVGWRFMEKIVQLPITIPPPTEVARHRYVASLVGEAKAVAGKETPVQAAAATPPAPPPRPEQFGEKEEAKVQEYIQKIGAGASSRETEKRSFSVVGTAPAEERWAAVEAAQRAHTQTLTEHDPTVAEFAESVAALVDGNPRQIKRYINVFRFYMSLRFGVRMETMRAEEEFPTDKVVAKFVALSIQWPHAVDCLRQAVEDGKGTKISLLKRLERESRGMGATSPMTDEAWKKLVSEELRLPDWAEERAFREFLGRGELLCEKEGHGLW